VRPKPTLAPLRPPALLRCTEAGATLTFSRWQLYVSADATTFDAFGRVLSGTVKVGQQVRVLGERYTPEDEEDMTLQTISDIWIYNTRCVLALMHAHTQRERG
jgi:116 kDa U5 small nuclear ribonucleoprotein component